MNLLMTYKKLSGIKWLVGEQGWDYQHPYIIPTGPVMTKYQIDTDTLGYPFGVSKVSVKQALALKTNANDTPDLLLTGGLYESPTIPVPASSILCRAAGNGFVGDVYMNSSFDATGFNNGRNSITNIDNSGIIDTKYYSGNMTSPIGYECALSVLKLGKSPGTRASASANTSGIIEPNSRAAFCMNSATRDATFSSSL